MNDREHTQKNTRSRYNLVTKFKLSAIQNENDKEHFNERSEEIGVSNDIQNEGVGLLQENPNSSLSSPSTLSPLIQACLLIVSVACCWVIAGDVVHIISFGMHINATFFLTWLCNCELSLLLLFHAIQTRGKIDKDLWIRAAKAGLKIFPLFVCAQTSYNLSLTETSITSTTVLSSTSSAFTLLLSYIVLHDTVDWIKITGVLITVCGASLTGLSDELQISTRTNTATPWIGDLLALFSAILYACYSVTTALVLKKRDSIESPPIQLVLGFVGLFNLVTLWPLIILLHVTKREDLSSLSPLFWTLVLSKGLFDNVLSGIMWAKAIKLSSPTLASVGLSLTIPLAVASDWALPYGNGKPNSLLIIGAVLTICGFILSAFSEHQNQERNDQQQQARSESSSHSSSHSSSQSSSQIMVEEEEEEEVAHRESTSIEKK